MTILLTDNGVGIPGEQKSRIFEQGGGKSSGLGLFLAREILSITGITITETGEAGKGVRFELLVPKGAYRFAEPPHKTM
jgi:signal transduction histidine kinase